VKEQDEESETGENAIDMCGYTGIFHRPKEERNKLVKLKEQAFLSILASNINTLADMMRTIKHIDKDNNGYVTTTEIEDILKIHYAQ
jgi:Ca2+-binding EF-hand superfamily protein